MYVAKRSRRGSALYLDEPDQRQPSWLTLHDDLRRAIEQGELTLFYQPRVEVRTGRLTHVEALVRWQHPQRGLLPPDRFIPLVEHSGLVGPFSAWVLNAALEQARRWREQGLDLAVSVNLSAQDLHDPQLPETLAHLLRRWAVPPGRVELEIVESGLVASRASAGDTLARLHALGVRIAVDDLGTGYSSFAYLTQLPLDELKIARSFVLQMALNQREAAVVRAMIGLAHDLGLTATAEGVEDETTWRLLSGLGCDRAQGYFIGRPMPPDALAHWIEGAEWAPAGPARTERSPE
jgi:EAL domain-containing protein (putative c-di-GMP-specific phosphodiesterase class I)